MKEVTTIVKAQITIIRKGEDISNVPTSEEQAKEMIADEIKAWLDADDVVVESVQNFVREDVEDTYKEKGV